MRTGQTSIILRVESINDKQGRSARNRLVEQGLPTHLDIGEAVRADLAVSEFEGDFLRKATAEGFTLIARIEVPAEEDVHRPLPLASSTTYFKDRNELLEKLIELKIANGGDTPTVRELKAACGASSTSVVTYNLRRLAEDKKIILRGGGKIIIPGFAYAPKSMIKTALDAQPSPQATDLDFVLKPTLEDTQTIRAIQRPNDYPPTGYKPT